MPNYGVDVVTISFAQLKDIWKLCKTKLNLNVILVLFVASWDREDQCESSLAHNLLQLQQQEESHISENHFAVYKVVVRGMDSAESYVIDTLRVHELPHAVIYSDGDHVKHSINKLSLNQQNYREELIFYLRIGPHFRFSPEHWTIQSGFIELLLLSASDEEDESHASPMRLFIAGGKSTAGKSSFCLALMMALIERFKIPPCNLSYIKPATQCEAEQPITRFCRNNHIACVPIGPVVYYKGFTRAFLSGETPSSEHFLQQVVNAVQAVGVGSRLQLVDGVGYAAVGSLCGLSNAHVALALRCPALLMGKAGVGDAVDSYNQDSAYLRLHGVPLLGAVFNRLPTNGFYSLAGCKTPVETYFRTQRPQEMPYGFIPDVAGGGEEGFEQRLLQAVLDHVDLERLIFDIWRYHLFLNVKSYGAPSPILLPVKRPSPAAPVESRGVKRSRVEIEQQALKQGAKGS